MADAVTELFVKSAKLVSLSSAEQGHVETIVRELCYYLALAVDRTASSKATGICRVGICLNLNQRRRHQLMGDILFQGLFKLRLCSVYCLRYFICRT
jgi:hypothetical protein